MPTWEYCTYQVSGRVSDADLDLASADPALAAAFEQRFGSKSVKSDQDRPGAYKLKKVRHVEAFALLGSRGWELVSHSDSPMFVGVFTFKRPLA